MATTQMSSGEDEKKQKALTMNDFYGYLNDKGETKDYADVNAFSQAMQDQNTAQHFNDLYNQHKRRDYVDDEKSGVKPFYDYLTQKGETKDYNDVYSFYDALQDENVMKDMNQRYASHKKQDYINSKPTDGTMGFKQYYDYMKSHYNDGQGFYNSPEEFYDELQNDESRKYYDQQFQDFQKGDNEQRQQKFAEGQRNYAAETAHEQARIAQYKKEHNYVEGLGFEYPIYDTGSNKRYKGISVYDRTGEGKEFYYANGKRALVADQHMSAQENASADASTMANDMLAIYKQKGADAARQYMSAHLPKYDYKALAGDGTPEQAKQNYEDAVWANFLQDPRVTAYALPATLDAEQRERDAVAQEQFDRWKGTGMGYDEQYSNDMNTMSAIDWFLGRSRNIANRTQQETDQNNSSPLLIGWNIAKSAARGLWDGVSGMEKWDFGLSDIQRAKAIRDAFTAYANGTATRAQRLLIQNYGTYSIAQSALSKNSSETYRMFNTTGESIPFMLQMLASPELKYADGATKGAIKWMTEKYGASRVASYIERISSAAAKSKLAKAAAELWGKLPKELVSKGLAKVAPYAKSAANGAAHVADSTLGGAYQTLKFNMGNVAAEAYDRMNGNVKMDFGNDGTYQVTGLDGYKGSANMSEDDLLKEWGKSWQLAFEDYTVQNGSELIGEYLAPFAQAVTGGIAKVTGINKLKKLYGVRNVSAFLDDVAKSDTMKKLKVMQKSMHWDGNAGEYSEEVVGNIANALLGVDGNFNLDPNDEDSVFNYQKNLDTYLGVAVMGTVFQAIGAGGYIRHNWKQRQANNILADANASGVGAFGADAWTKIKHTLDDMGTDFSNVNRLVADNKKNGGNDLQEQAIRRYCAARLQVTALNRIDDAILNDEDTDANTAIAKQAYDSGYSITDQKDMNDAKNEYESVGNELANAMGLDESADVAKEIGLNADASNAADVMQLVAQNPNMSDDQKDLVSDFIKARLRYQGLVDNAKDGINEKIAASNKEVDSNTNENGQIQHAMTKENQDVIVLRGNVQTDGEGNVIPSTSDSTLIVKNTYTGRMEMIPASDLLTMSAPQSAEDIKKQSEAQIRQSIGQQRAQAINGTLQFNAGDLYEVNDADGNTTKVQIMQDNGDGTVTCNVNGEQQVLRKADIQQGAEQNALMRLNEYRDSQKQYRTSLGETAPEVDSNIPVDENGKKQYEKASVDDTYDSLEAELGADGAQQIAEYQKRKAEQALKEAQAMPTDAEDIADQIQQMKAKKAAIDEAQTKYNYWNNVANTQQQRAAAEQKERERVERIHQKQAENRKAYAQQKAKEQAQKVSARQGVAETAPNKQQAPAQQQTTTSRRGNTTSQNAGVLDATGMNLEKKAPKLVKFAEAVGKALGQRIVFVPKSNQWNGKNVGGNIYVAMNADEITPESTSKTLQDVIAAALGHEISHTLFDNVDMRNSFVPLVKQYLGKKYDALFREQYQTYQMLYIAGVIKEPITADYIDEEIACNMAGQLLQDPEFMDMVINGDTTPNHGLLQRIAQCIDNVLQKIGMHLPMTDRARLEQMRNAWLNAFNQTQGIVNGTAEATNQTQQQETTENANETTSTPDVIETEGEAVEAAAKLSAVKDSRLLEILNNSPKIIAYRAMRIDEDGSIYSPMSEKLGGKKAGERVKNYNPEFKQWEQSDENLDKAEFNEGDEYAHIYIDKGEGNGTLRVAYNPYIHASRYMLNDQFESAWKRWNLQTVRVEIPAFEVEGDNHYKAKGAKNSVGEVEWTAGDVASKLPKNKRRKVILSRYDRPVEVVPVDEYAQAVKEQLDGTGIDSIPFNCVTPEQRDALVKAGIKIGEPTNGNAGEASRPAYEAWKMQQQGMSEAEVHAATGLCLDHGVWSTLKKQATKKYEKELAQRTAQEYKQQEVNDMMEGKAGTVFNENGELLVENTDGVPKFSIKTWEEGGRDALSNYLDGQVEQKLITREEADNMLAEMDRLTTGAKDIAKGKPNSLFGQWSYEVVRMKDGTKVPVMHALKKNSEYELNIDFSTVCKKRQVIDHLFNKMINEGYLQHETLSSVDIARMNQIIQKHGLEIACGICFVDSKRYNAYLFADGFLDKYNPTIQSLMPDAEVAGFNYSNDSKFTNEGKVDLTQYDEKVDWDEVFAIDKNHPEALKKYDLDWNYTYEILKPIYDKARAFMKDKAKFPDKFDSYWRNQNKDALIEFIQADYEKKGKKIAKSKLKADDLKKYMPKAMKAGAIPKPTKQDMFEYAKGIQNANANAEQKFAMAISQKPNLRKVAKAEDFIASEGWVNVVQSNSDLETLWNIQKGAAGARPNESNVQYQSDVLNKDITSDIFDIGGYRMQSFSDFIGRMYFDYMQAFADLAAKALPAHAYTKEPSFVKLFGMMGIKINMSLVSQVDSSMPKEYAGLTRDKDGNIVYNFHTTIKDADGNIIQQGQTFPPEEAFALQKDPRYTKNVGTIAVGLSREHIRKLLRDPNIRMVIPYHKSGLPHGVAAVYNINEINDYTNQQNTIIPNAASANDAKAKRKDVDQYNFILHQLSIAEDPKAAYTALYDLIVNNNVGAMKDMHKEYEKRYQKAVKGDLVIDAVADVNPSTRHEDNDFLPKAAADIYLAACDKRGYIPRFDEFRTEHDYYKVLEDFAVYDDNGDYTPQGVVKFQVPDNVNEYIAETLQEDEDINAKELAETDSIVKEIENYLDNKPLREKQDAIADKPVAEVTDEERAFLQTNIYNVGDPRVGVEDGAKLSPKVKAGSVIQSWGRTANKFKINPSTLTHEILTNDSDKIVRLLEKVSEDTSNTVKMLSCVGGNWYFYTVDGDMNINIIDAVSNDEKNYDKFKGLYKEYIDSTPESVLLNLPSVGYTDGADRILFDYFLTGRSAGNNRLGNGLSKEGATTNGQRIDNQNSGHINRETWQQLSNAYIKAIAEGNQEQADEIRKQAISRGMSADTFDKWLNSGQKLSAKQTTTPEFKNWFGDWEKDPANASKVVDEDGKPKVVYHGTNHYGFNIFKDTETGTFLTDSENAAEYYESENKTEKDGTYKCYLNIQHPFNIDAQGKNYTKLNAEYNGIKLPAEYKTGYYADTDGWAKYIKEHPELGYDGIIIKDINDSEPERGLSTDYVVFKPEQIKSATDNNGDFDPNNPDIRYSAKIAASDPFYSNAAKSVEGIKQNKATGDQWLAMIKKAGGLKAEEDKWMGLSDWLAGKKSVTKEEVEQFIADNAVKVEDVNYSDEAQAGFNVFDKHPEAQAKFDEIQEYHKQVLADQKKKVGDTWKAYVNAADIVSKKYGAGFDSAFENIDDDGNLRVKPRMEQQALEILGVKVDNPINATRMKYTTEGLENNHEIALTVPTVEPYTTGNLPEVHFADKYTDGKTVAWVRFGDANDTEGNRVLVVDEIQSQRHQDGRENGYAEGGVPDAPFRKNWQELGMKRVLRYAAENGYDKVAWTTGQQQSDRYNMSKVLNRIGRADEPDMQGRQIYLNLTTGKPIALNVDDEGKILDGEYKDKNITSIVGKELAEKAMSLKDNSFYSLDKNTNIANSGMQGFYDRILPQFMDKYGKKWGVKTHDITLDLPRPEDQVMHAVDVTDEMKDSVMQGQAMFSAKVDGMLYKHGQTHYSDMVAPMRYEDNATPYQSKNLSPEGAAHMELYADPKLNEARKAIKDLSVLLGGHAGDASNGAFQNKTEGVSGIADTKKAQVIGANMYVALKNYRELLASIMNKGSQTKARQQVFGDAIKDVDDAIDWYFEFAQGLRNKLGQHDEDGIRFSIKGIKGATDEQLKDLTVAEDMKAAGKTALAIKKATGWEIGADGKWRYEIPDGSFTKSLDDIKKKLNNVSAAVSLRDIWEDDELFKSYPALESVTVKKLANNSDANGDYGNNVIRLRLNRTQDEIRHTLIHEIQHFIQRQEGFATGGNENIRIDAIRQLAEKQDAQAGNVGKTFRKLYPRLGMFSEYDGVESLEDDYIELGISKQFLDGLENVIDFYPEFFEGLTSKELKEMANPYTSDLTKHLEKIYGISHEEAYSHEVYKTISEMNRSNYKVEEIPANMDDLNSLREDIENAETFLYQDLDTWLKQWKKLGLQEGYRGGGRLGYDGYRSVAGEVEARNAARRSDMSEKDRRKTLLSKTEDVARKDQLILNAERNGFERAKAKYSTKASAANQTARSLNLPAEVIWNETEIPEGVNKDTKGWVDDNGKVHVVLPNCTNDNDVKATVLHEAVGRYGLRKVMGDDNYNNFIRDLYMDGSEETRRAIGKYLPYNNWDYIKATEQYCADFANKDDIDMPLWKQVKHTFLNALRHMGVNVRLSDEDVQYMLWKAKNALHDGDFFDRAADISKQMDLGIGNYARYSAKKPAQFLQDSARMQYDRMAASKYIAGREAWQDSMITLREMQNILAQTSGSPITGWENAYLAENRMHGTCKNEAEWYDQNFYKPMLQAVADLMKKHSQKITSNDITDYLIAKHGIERNTFFAFKEGLDEYEKIQKDAIKAQKVATGMSERKAEREAAQEARQLRNSIYNSYQMDADLLQAKDDYRNGVIDYRDYTDKVREVMDRYVPATSSSITDKSGLTGLTGSKDDYESEAFDIIDGIERDYSVNADDINNLWDKINAATKESLKKTRDSGRMTKEAYDYVNGMFDFYVPLRGWEETTADEVYNYRTTSRGAFNPSLKKMKGRKSNAESPLAYIGNMAVSEITIGNQNLVKQYFLRMVQNHPSTLATVSETWYQNIGTDTNPKWIVRTPDITETMTADEITDEIDRFTQEMEQLKANGEATNERGQLKVDYPIVDNEKTEHKVKVMVDGKEFTIFINGDPKVAQAINGTNTVKNTLGDGVINKWIIGSIKKLNRFVAEKLTSQNPAFVFSNLCRDMLAGQTQIFVKESPAYIAQFEKNVGTILRPRFADGRLTGAMPMLLRKWKKGTLNENVPLEKYFDEFMRNGGETGFVATLAVDDFKKNIQHELNKFTGHTTKIADAWEAFTDTVEFYNRAVEDVTRFTTYMTSRMTGKSLEDSIFDAKNISLNFDKSGSGDMLNRTARDLYIFINPAIQALQNMVHLITTHPVRFTGIAAAYITRGAMQPVLNEMMINLFGDDDDKDTYWSLPERVRRNNLIFYIPCTHNFFTMPLSQEYRIWHSLGETINSVMTGHSEENAMQEFLVSLMDLLPLNPFGNEGNIWLTFTPQFAKPAYEVHDNQTFSGYPVYKDADSYKYEPEFQTASYGTPSWMVKTSKYLNYLGGGNEHRKGAIEKFTRGFGEVGELSTNPSVWNHLLNGYFGGTYNFIAQTLGTGMDIVEYAKGDGERPKMNGIPIVSRFLARPLDKDDRGKVTNADRAQFDNADEIRSEYSHFSNDAMNGDEQAMNELDRIAADPDFERAMGVEAYKSIIQDLQKSIRESNNKEEKEELVKSLQEILNDFRQEYPNK